MSPVPPVDDEHRALFAELITRSDGIGQLDRAQQRAWVSGLLGSWRGDIVVPDPGVVDRQFVNFCRDEPPEGVAHTVVCTLADTAEQLLAPQLDPELTVVGAWAVDDRRHPDQYTVIIALRHNGDEHTIVASVANGILIDVHQMGAVDDLFDALQESSSPGTTASSIAPQHALDTLVEAWESLTEHITAPGGDNDSGAEVLDGAEALVANQLAVRADLIGLGVDGNRLATVVLAPPDAPGFFADLSPSEITDGDRWAVEALRSALRRYATVIDVDREQAPALSTPPSLACVQAVFVGPLDDLSPREQRAIVYLEWADWVGAIAALMGVDSAVDAHIDGDTIVDLINRQPELTSAIDEADRDYVAYAFDVALAMWSDCGLLDGGRLVPGAKAAIVSAAFTSWENRPTTQR